MSDKLTITRGIEQIRNNPEIPGPIDTFDNGLDNVEIFFAGTSPYYENFMIEGAAYTWLIDENGREHAIIMLEEYYQDFKELYTEKYVFGNLAFHRKSQKNKKIGAFLSLGIAAFLIFVSTLIGILIEPLNVLVMFAVGVATGVLAYLIVAMINMRLLSNERKRAYDEMFEGSQVLIDLQENETDFIRTYIDIYYKKLDEYYESLEQLEVEGEDEDENTDNIENDTTVQ